MTLPLWLITGLGWLRKAAQGLFGIASRYPWQTACIALLCACVWLWHGWDGAKADYEGCKTARAADHKAYIEAQAEAAAKAKAARLAKEAEYAQKAKEADDHIAKAQADANAAAAEYIRTHRLRAPIAGSPGGPGIGAQGSDPELPAPVPADPVVVSEGDVQACTGAVTYAIEAHNWAIGPGQ